MLLHKLGFHLAADVGKCFPRIPHFWSADHILQLVQKLGPIRESELNFNRQKIHALMEKIVGDDDTEELLPPSSFDDMAMMSMMGPGGGDPSTNEESNLDLFAK